ncbi:MAG: 1-(5-phosphoribosyl)-5-[(5-phosphoribosylamino)methylideneamino]imidazole-4-carboxamide isomerase [Clostridia bacterium]|nr:1-(5-phosphoribosyl)-5-[(5-phosphoribosylamino)methylideneamino]imidazole-4-carboxamide isomerase [Clostridia bacterium]
MKLFPAVDLLGGRAVRLYQGDYAAATVYADDPVVMVHRFQADGAACLHVVDLDGAREGTPANFGVVRRIAEEGGLFLEVGGGIRDEPRVAEYLALGVDRVILGTVAAQNFPFVEEMSRKYGEAIAVGVDARDGKVAVGGWLETTAIPSVEFCRRCAGAGVKTVIYTDISRDGAMQGTNLAVYDTLSGISGLDVVASGGISSLHEIRSLAQRGVYGAIVGKAVYEGVLDLKDCLRAAEGGAL